MSPNLTRLIICNCSFETTCKSLNYFFFLLRKLLACIVLVSVIFSCTTKVKGYFILHRNASLGRILRKNWQKSFMKPLMMNPSVAFQKMRLKMHW